MIELNDRKFYDWFNNPFTVYGIIPAFNISTTPIDDISRQNKILWYTSDKLPATIFFLWRLR